MKNSELLSTNPELLSSLERQRQYIAQKYATPIPCPNMGCNKPVNVFDALGITIDEYDFGSYEPERGYKCPHCGYKLRMIVPIIMTGQPGHHWEIDEPLPTKTTANK